MSTTTVVTTPTEMRPYREVRIGRQSLSLVPPSIRDPRIHLSSVIITILVIGLAWLDFQLSIAQILVTLGTCSLIELTVTGIRTKMLVWPASALQTGTSTSLLLRVVGTENGQWWSMRGWYIFAGVAAIGLLTKYAVRFRSGHVFNPSNVALVAVFLVLGSHRVEPLDFWWAPLGPAMIAAYVVILAGGVFICSRLGLIGMGLTFWATLAAGMGVLAAMNRSMTTRWSLTPIEGAHFWWIILTSPEIFIFLYFMITDPRTVPAGRVARIAFGFCVGALASLLMAPWKTEFGVKVGLLSSLTAMCLCRKQLERHLPAVGSPEDDPRRFFGRLFTGSPSSAADRCLPDDVVGSPRPVRTRRVMARSALGALAFGALATGVSAAGLPGRAEHRPQLSAADIDMAADVDPASLPAVSIDRKVAGISAGLATPAGAQALAADLAWNLEVESEAIMTGDASLLTAVDDGARLNDLRSMIDANGSGDRVVPSYTFTSLRLVVVYPGGLQRGANAGLISTGTVTDTTYTASGERRSSNEHMFAFTFALRPTTDGKWLVTDTLDKRS